MPAPWMAWETIPGFSGLIALRFFYVAWQNLKPEKFPGGESFRDPKWLGGDDFVGGSDPMG